MTNSDDINDVQKWEMTSDHFMLESIKTELTLASGTFIVSLAFLSNFKILFYKGILLISWFFLIFSLITGMCAMTSGIVRYRRSAQGKMGKLEGKEKELYEKGKALTSFEAKMPSLQRWSFVIGLLSFILFVAVNVWSYIKW